MQYSSLIILAVLVAGAEMCADTNANCPSWVANGFCTSNFYTSSQKTQYCPASCGLCSGVSSTAASSSSASGVCIDTSTSCATWDSNGFCSSLFYTTEQKRQFCAYTCNLCSSDTVTTRATITTTTA
ncbi:unnamed protein product [Caenorhabditis nigoni]